MNLADDDINPVWHINITFQTEGKKTYAPRYQFDLIPPHF